MIKILINSVLTEQVYKTSFIRTTCECWYYSDRFSWIQIGNAL